jgi:hypothetical protein
MSDQISNKRSLVLLKQQAEELQGVMSELGDRTDALLKQQAALSVVHRAIENEMDRIRANDTASEVQLELDLGLE